MNNDIWISLRDPIWQFWGAVIAAIAVVIGLITWWLQRDRKSLDYQILALTPIIQVGGVNSGRFRSSNILRVTFNGEDIANPYFLLIKLGNTGNIPIPASDFERGISVCFSNNTRVLNAEIQQVHPPGLNVKLSFTDQLVSIDPCLLNPSDYFVVAAILSDYSGTVEVTARIEGVKQIRQREALGETAQQLLINVAVDMVRSGLWR